MTATGRILDRGHRPFDGPRGGRLHAIRVLVGHGIGRAVGRRRPWWTKLAPAVIVVISLLPAVAYLGVVSLIDLEEVEEQIVPTYAEYSGIILFAIILLLAFVAPEIVCTDRRSGLIALYLASPLTRSDYVLAKTLSVAIVMCAVTVVPLLVLFAGYVAEGLGPEWPLDGIATLGRVIAGGLVITASATALSMGVASWVTRSAAAAALLVGVTFGGAIIAVLLVEGDLGAGWAVLDVLGVAADIVRRIHGETAFPEDVVARLSTPVVVAAWLAQLTLFGGSAWWRYRRLQVSV